MSKTHTIGNEPAVLAEFFPFSIDSAQLSPSVPADIQAEFREAELCASVGARRGAAALLRSTLEKALVENGYTDQVAGRTLTAKINKATEDGVLTQPRKQSAQDIVKVLGDEVLHRDWREVEPEEVDRAHHYVQRILEDFYDDRPTVASILKDKKRFPPPAEKTAEPEEKK